MVFAVLSIQTSEVGWQSYPYEPIITLNYDFKNSSRDSPLKKEIKKTNLQKEKNVVCNQNYRFKRHRIRRHHCNYARHGTNGLILTVQLPSEKIFSYECYR